VVARIIRRSKVEILLSLKEFLLKGKATTMGFRNFSVLELLNTEEDIQEYLQLVEETGDKQYMEYAQVMVEVARERIAESEAPAKAMRA